MGTQRIARAAKPALVPALCAFWGFQLGTAGPLGQLFAAVCLIGLMLTEIGKHLPTEEQWTTP